MTTLKKISQLSIALLVSFQLLACSSDSTSKDPVTGYDIHELGYSPESRWPEGGEFSYNYKITYNGVSCTTKKKFSGKAAYCMGLQDQKLNENCALETRKRVYGLECGNDFQQLNFSSPLYISGFDQRLQKTCQIDTAKDVYFKTQKQYCQFLADESRHKECHWDRRLEKFEELQCQGPFSPEPSVSTPELPSPSPGQEPDPQTPPTPKPLDPLDLIPVVQVLRANGYEVKVDYEAIRDSQRHRYDGIPLEQKMKTVWSELESIQQELLSRKGVLKTLVVSIYTTNDGNTLYFDYETASGQARMYFPLKETANELSRQLGISYSFIESSGGSFEPLAIYINLLDSNRSALAAVQGTIQEFSYGSYNHYFSKSRELKLKNDANIERAFTAYLEQLKVLAPTYAWADKNSIELDNEFDLEKHLQQLAPVFKTLNSEIKSLDLIAQAGLIKNLSINYFSSETKYWPALKKLSINTTPGNNPTLLKNLKAMAHQAKISLEIQIPTNLKMESLGEEYHQAVLLLQGAAREIKGKSGQIERIDLGYNTAYYPALKLLSIDSKSTLNEVLKVVRDIP